MNVPTSPRVLSPDERKGILAQRIAYEVANGGRVESQMDYQAVIVRGKRVNHVLHLILALVTAGIWVIGWIIAALAGGEKRTVIGVDEFGFVQVR